MRGHRSLLRSELRAGVLAVLVFAGDGEAGIHARFISRVEIFPKAGQIPVLGVRVVRAYPHDPHAFTQGLEYYGGYLYESTGIAGQSTLRKVALRSGQVIRKVSLPPQYFGEGL